MRNETTESIFRNFVKSFDNKAYKYSNLQMKLYEDDEIRRTDFCERMQNVCT